MTGLSGDSARLPREITAGGRTRTVTDHLRRTRHDGITAERLEYILDNWLIRGIDTDERGRLSVAYLGFVPRLDNMVRVMVSGDNERVITAFQDSTATRNWNKGYLDYFDKRYRNVEMRDES